MAIEKTFKKRVGDKRDYTIDFSTEMTEGERIAELDVDVYKNVSQFERTVTIKTGDAFVLHHNKSSDLAKDQTYNVDADQDGVGTFFVRLGDWTDYTSEIMSPGDFGVDVNNPQKVTMHFEDGEEGATYFLVITATTEFGEDIVKHATLYIQTD